MLPLQYYANSLANRSTMAYGRGLVYGIANETATFTICQEDSALSEHLFSDSIITDCTHFCEVVLSGRTRTAGGTHVFHPHPICTPSEGHHDHTPHPPAKRDLDFLECDPSLPL